MENAFQNNVQSQNQNEINPSSKKKTLFVILGSFLTGSLTAYLILSAGGNAFKGSFINEPNGGPALTLAGEYKDNAIILTWTDTTGEEVIGYRIERADAIITDEATTDASQKFKALKVIKSSAPYEYIDTEIQSEKNYLYIVRSFKPDRTEAVVSNEFQITASEKIAPGISACKCSESAEIVTSEIFTPEAVPIIPVFTPEPTSASRPESIIEVSPAPAPGPESTPIIPASESTPEPTTISNPPEPSPASSRSSR